MSEPLIPEREQEIRETQLGNWYDGPWTQGYVEGSGDDLAYYRVKHAESGTTLATLPDWAGPIALFIADAHDAVPELLAELDRVRVERDQYANHLDGIHLAQWEDKQEAATGRATKIRERADRRMEKCRRRGQASLADLECTKNEVHELAAEIDRLRQDNRAAHASEQILQQQIDAQAKEIDRFRGRITELEKAAVEGRAALGSLCYGHEDPGAAALGALYLLTQATVWTETGPDFAADALARHDADRLDAAAESIEAGCPDHGTQDEAWMDCHCVAAEELNRQAEALRKGGA